MNKPTKAAKAAQAAADQIKKAANEAVLKVAKLLRDNPNGDGRVRQRINEVIDSLKGSVAVEVYQRAEIRNARLGAVQTVLVKI